LKLIGSAQVREGTAFLQHGSILLQNEQDVVNRVSHREHLDLRATSLAAAAGKTVSFEQVTRAITDEVARSWPGDWRIDRMPTTAAGPAPDFTDPAWTWRR
jgi:lipoate-protein ligase A